jgi:hypothetical protein
MDTSWQQLFPGTPSHRFAFFFNPSVGLLSPDSLQAQADNHTTPDDYFGYSAPMYSDLWNAASPITANLQLAQNKAAGQCESEGSSVTFDTTRGFLDTPPPPAPAPQQRASRRRSSLSTPSAAPSIPVEVAVTKAQASGPKKPGRRRKITLPNQESSSTVDYVVELEQKTTLQDGHKNFAPQQHQHQPPQKAQAPIPIASMATHSAVPVLPRISPAPPGLQFAKAFQKMVEQQQNGDPVKTSPHQMRAPIPPPPLGLRSSLPSTTPQKRERSASVPKLPSHTIPILANTVNPMDLMNKSTRSQVTELKRRKLTQESFEQLQELISPEFCEPKASRAVILAGAVDYITHLQRGIAELKKMIETFRKSSVKKASSSEGIDTSANENNE